MFSIVFSQNFNLAAEVIVRTADELILAYVPMLLYILPQDLYATLIVTFDNFKQTALIMCLKVLEHDD